MPKKYLLYIHSDRFADEEKKSELVNELLESHYSEGPKIIKTPADAMEAVKPLMVKPLKRKTQICPVHNIDKEFCKLMKH